MLNYLLYPIVYCLRYVLGYPHILFLFHQGWEVVSKTFARDQRSSTEGAKGIHGGHGVDSRDVKDFLLSEPPKKKFMMQASVFCSDFFVNMFFVFNDDISFYYALFQYSI